MTVNSLDARLAGRQAEQDLPHRQTRWRRITSNPAFMHYNRLILLVALANLALLVYAVTRQGWLAGDGIPLQTLSNLVLANLAMAILIRQQYVINLLFWLATSAPTSWPLAIRRTLGKVYHFGGLHVGGAVMGTVWFAVFVATLASRLIRGLPGVSPAMVAVTGTLLAVLMLMIVMSLPSIRSRHHDAFERTHRFGGWIALLLFWLQSLLFVAQQRGPASLGQALLASPSFWVLIVLTASILLPWLRLRRVPVEIESPSTHVALARFDHGVTPFAGSSTAVSRRPLLEWHSFANVPAPDEAGFKLTISRAGDWTGAFIDDAPSHV